MTTAAPRYTASVAGDPIDSNVTRHSSSARMAALAVREYAKFGEVITIVGPRGGFTYWQAVGNGNVWKVSSPLAVAA